MAFAPTVWAGRGLRERSGSKTAGCRPENRVCEQRAPHSQARDGTLSFGLGKQTLRFGDLDEHWSGPRCIVRAPERRFLARPAVAAAYWPRFVSSGRDRPRAGLLRLQRLERSIVASRRLTVAFGFDAAPRLGRERTRMKERSRRVRPPSSAPPVQIRSRCSAVDLSARRRGQTPPSAARHVESRIDRARAREPARRRPVHPPRRRAGASRDRMIVGAGGAGTCNTGNEPSQPGPRHSQRFRQH